MYNDVYNKEQFAYMHSTLCKWLKIKVEGKSLGDIIKKRYNSNILLYGIGGLGEIAFDDIINSEIGITCIVDKKYKSYPNGYRGIDVVGLEGIGDYAEYPILVIPVFYFKEIVDELIQHGVKAERIVSLNMLLG